MEPDNNKNDNNSNKPKDRSLRTPSVANEEKHINFLAEEENASNLAARIDLQNEEDEQRKKQWQEGIEAGKDARKSEPPFQKKDLDEQEEY